MIRVNAALTSRMAPLGVGDGNALPGLGKDIGGELALGVLQFSFTDVNQGQPDGPTRGVPVLVVAIKLGVKDRAITANHRHFNPGFWRLLLHAF